MTEIKVDGRWYSKGRTGRAFASLVRDGVKLTNVPFDDMQPGDLVMLSCKDCPGHLSVCRNIHELAPVQDMRQSLLKGRRRDNIR